MYIYIIANFMNSINKNLIKGSFFVSPARGCGGAKANNINNNSSSAKKWGEVRKQTDKLKGFLKSIESFCWLIWRFANLKSLRLPKEQTEPIFFFRLY